MTIGKTEYDKLPELEQAEHQEKLMDLFNQAFFKIEDRKERKDIVDLINIYAGIRFQSRLFKINTGSEQYYGMFPIELGSDEETKHLQGKLSSFFHPAERVVPTDEVSPGVSLTSDDIDTVLEKLAIGFSKDVVTYESLREGLKFYIVKEAEVELLKLEGRIVEGN